ncbi:MAG: ATP-dependent RecD-like DNA helicase [Lachnospiraceae bacterium]|nr:ATP-dependent RecD-like DNA helicase [Lachnospiraceae bacterium]
MEEAHVGYVEKIKFRNEENGYTVFDLAKKDDDGMTCTGICPQINVGEKVEIKGSWVVHRVHGPQLSVSAITVMPPDDTEAAFRYLASGAIKGIGEVMAKRIVDKFGEDTFRIMEEEPERLADIKGISMKMAMKISAQFDEKKEMRQAMMFLQQYGISNELAVKIYQQYREDMYNVIRNNPYRLADDIKGVGFKIADEIGRRVGIDRESEFRKRSAISYALAQSVGMGNVYMPENELISFVQNLLGIGEIDLTHELDDLVMDKVVIRKMLDEQVIYYSSYMYYMELNCSRMLLDLNCEFRMSEERIKQTIKRIERNKDIDLADRQKQAVGEALCHGVLVVTGGPGTGKTTTIDAIISAFEEEGMDIMLAAPTGRAAKRMTETTGYPAQTIHRLLELSGSVEDDENVMAFERNELYPLETDVIIIDEMSMVDLPLLNALLKAIVVGTRLVMVGDVNQLPSVGPGNVLRDIINSECFTVVMLNEVFRQARDSDIIMNAHKINAGEHISLDNKSRDFFMLERNESSVIINVILQLIIKNLPGYVDAGMLDIQVLSPMRKGELGVENLNIQLQKYINPPSPAKPEILFRETVFREGDKVMQIKNNYQTPWERRGYHGVLIEEGTGVFNGDSGIIRRVDPEINEITVEFEDNKYVVYQYGSLEELELAYAITVHKSQGSEYPAVIIPLLTGSSLLLHRNLLYTAVTRAKKCVTIVGMKDTVNYMIENERELRRYSTFDIKIKEMIV